MPQGFVFVNISDAPGLSVAETKRMRAHVTKTNFAQRRRRIAQQYQQAEALKMSPKKATRKNSRLFANYKGHQGSMIPPFPDPVTEYTLLLSPTDTDLCVRYLMHDFRPLVFPTGTGAPYGLDESTWADQLVSEPALLNASMFVKLRFFSEYTGSVTRQASMYICMAIGLINKELSGTLKDLSDGMLAAVFMLGVGERLSNNKLAWDAHIEGLTQMIILRRAQGNGFIQQWFADLLLYDSICESVMSSDAHHTKHIDAIRENNSQLVSQVSSISRRINRLREAFDQYYDFSGGIKIQNSQFQDEVSDIQTGLKVLQCNESTYVRALGKSLELFLSLSWSPTAQIDYDALVEGLKDALANPYTSPCSSFHLKIWQYFVGAVAVDSASDARVWFTEELKRMFRVIGTHSWDEVTVILKRTFFPNSRLLHRFKSLWYELGVP